MVVASSPYARQFQASPLERINVIRKGLHAYGAVRWPT
jgi:hypothetical protein